MGNIIELYTLKTMSEADKKRIMQRAQEEIDTIYPQVRKVIDDVRQHGDEALFKYMQEFDGVTLNATTVKVGKEEIQEAYQKIDAILLESLKTLHKQVQRFHDFQKPQEWMTELSPGLLAGQMIVPLDIVGCYSPGGRGWFPSTCL
jgi:histidinol dehydrogenase